MRVVQKLHGELLNGRLGSAFVELAACWMIVLIVTGLYLTWPRRRTWARALWPPLERASGRWVRQVHGALGIWVSGLILLFLASGLPWTGVWGEGFEQVRRWAGAASPESGTHGGAGSHGGQAAGSRGDGLAAWSRSGEEGRVNVASAAPAPGAEPIRLQAVVERASREALAPPVEIAPPRDGDGVWTVRSMTQRRPDRVTLHYDRWSGEERMRIGFADQHPLQRTVSYGIAFHEGQLFGALNQALGVLTALGVIAMSGTGLVMWWRRRPRGTLGAPALPADLRLARGVVALVIAFAVFFPLVGASLLAVALGDAAWSRIALWRAERPIAWSQDRR
jgi:uncharacterized iron-regulated membrane protein